MPSASPRPASPRPANSPLSASPRSAGLAASSRFSGSPGSETPRPGLAGYLERRRWDPQPREPAAVLLASSGAPFSRAAARRARDLAAGQPIAVISILRVYGSSFGLPNPGLLPTRRERDEQLGIVDRVLKDLEKLGCAADGQVTATRSAGRTIAKAARARGVSYVVMDAVTATGIRRIMEGELTAVVRRRLRGAAELDIIDASLTNGH